jgi:ABC-type transport system substrate-binding protein
MAKIAAVLIVLASFLLVAPVIESSTPTPVSMFHAVGNAEGGDGGGW